jgi:DNA adenine methylase
LPLVSAILRANQLQRCHYVEPYAGGGGLALSLLFGGYVSDIHINDLDASIWAFWKSALDHTEELVRLIETTPIDIKEWRRQKAIQSEGDPSNPVALGFAAFFLNRTNRSGIIKGAGVIGGLKQKGSYKIDCRFNRDDLARRIRRISKYRSRIHLTREDAIDFMRQSADLPPETLFCIDPPYFSKGSKLYTSFYGPDDHAAVAEAVLSIQHPWIVTYDNADEIRELYRNRRQFEFDINYSVQTKRVGTELLVVSKGLRLSSEIREHQLNDA